MRPGLLCIFFTFLSFAMQAQSGLPIGSWREHLSYHNVVNLEEIGKNIWAATPFAIFRVNPEDNEIERLSKINGLTSTNIRSIGKDAGSERLIVVYADGNIDVVDDKGVHNVPDIYTSRSIADKTINQVYSAAGNTWLAGNEAIYLLDPIRYEILETFIIGTDGNKTEVRSMTVSGDSIFAATSQGLKSASLNAPNLSDFRSWQEPVIAGLPMSLPNELFTLGNRLIARYGDSLFVKSGNSWNLFFTDPNGLVTINASGDRLFVSQQVSSGARVLVLNENGDRLELLRSPGLITVPKETLLLDNIYWLADSISGLVKISDQSREVLIPSSPRVTLAADLISVAGKTIVTAGGITSTGDPLNRPALYSVFEAEAWKNYDSATVPFTGQTDLQVVLTDPADGALWLGSAKDGLIKVDQSNNLLNFKQNSFIQENISRPGLFQVTGLAFDSGNNLWIANYGASEPIVVRKPDGTARSFRPLNFSINENAVTQIVIDDFNQKWIISPGNEGLLCFSHGSSIDNPADDAWKKLRAGVGNGNLPSDRVISLAMDLDGQLWIGTESGLAVLRCLGDVFSAAGCDAFRPIVQQDNFAGFLFSDETVQAIAVDGANRKWVGTKNGLWLLSENGESIIYRFSADNSPLLSDDVRGLSIDPSTGELFVATDRGICSFKSTATRGTEVSSNVLVFPNPVPPGYTGAIAVRGVANNAIVKITEMNGNLVYQTRALGGQAIWNGKDYRGRKISSGVYLVLVSDETKKDQVSTKIVFISR